MKKYLIIILSAICFFSCEKDYENDYIGNSLNDQFGDLIVYDSLRSSSEIFSFQSNNRNYFEAEWSKNLNWELTITGTESNAQKMFSGFNSFLSIENSEWRGYADDFPSFKAEECIAELVLIDNESQLIMSTSITTSDLKSEQEDIFIVADFEGGTPPQNSIEFSQAGASLSVAQGNAAKGSYYYAMGGNVSFDYYLGSIKIPFDNNEISSEIPSALVFFNMGIIGGAFGEVPTDQFVKILARENDGDVYVTSYDPVNWSDWQLKSLSYSEFELESFTDQTNGQHDPSEIFQIEVMCLSCPSSSAPDPNAPLCPENEDKTVKTDIDFIAFTINEAYKP